jgi:hypothetical protein
MKICTVCSCEHKQPRSPNCVKCQRKINFDRCVKKSKAKRAAYQLEYAKKNPEKRKLWARKAYCNKVGITLDQLKPRAPEGSGHINTRGYRVLCKKDHPNVQSAKGWIHEHIVVMSEHLGRPLVKGEVVHHRNGIKHDNRIENLELWHRPHPPGQRVDDKIEWCKEFLAQHGYTIVNQKPQKEESKYA